MTKTLIQKPLVVKKSAIHGFGVFAEKNFKPNEIIEECYTLLTDTPDPSFSNYYFSADEKSSIPLGFGCIYNHSDYPNAFYDFDSERQVMVFKARRFIHKGEEIFTSYGKTWFDNRAINAKNISPLKRAWRYFRGMPLRALTIIACILGLVKLINLMTLFSVPI